MNLPSIKDLVKENTVRLNRFKSGNLFYIIYLFDQKMPDNHSAHRTWEFPVPISDVGEAEMRGGDKAIYFMRYIKKAIEDKTFIEI
jgi:hypothetical protein